MKKTVSVNGNIRVYDCFLVIAYLLGMFSTMPVVGAKIAGHFLTAFSVLFIGYCGLLFVFFIHRASHGVAVKLSIGSLLLLGFFLWSLMGFVMGYGMLSSSWRPYTSPYVFKAIEYALILLMMYWYNDRKLIMKYTKGFLMGCVLNCIWSILQGLAFMFFRVFLNTMLFPDSNGEIWTKYGGVRAGGFNPDPASIGVLLPIVFYYAFSQKKYWLLIICALSLVFSQSTTAIVGCCVVFMGYRLWGRGKSFTDLFPRKLKKNTKLLLSGLIVVAFIVGVTYIIKSGVGAKLVRGIQNYVDGFLLRMNENYIQTNDKGPRAIYYENALRLLMRRNVLFVIFGSGLGTSMEPYSEYSLFGNVGVDTFGEIEATYLAYLFDCGIVGLLLFLAFLGVCFFALIKRLRKNHDEMTSVFFGFLLSVISSNIFYHYILAASQVMVFICIVSYLNCSRVSLSPDSILSKFKNARISISYREAENE